MTTREKLNDAISITTLANGEYIGMTAINIVSIPYIQNQSDDKIRVKEAIKHHQNNMRNLLSEIYQFYKNSHNSNEFSLELLWTTKSVSNQPYNAEISLYLILRVINAETNAIHEQMNLLLQFCVSTLEMDKYEASIHTYDEIAEDIERLDDDKITAIVKEEQIENLQNPILPYCFSYGKFPKNEEDFGKLVNSLINYPDAAVSFQLIPTQYTESEITELTNTTQMLETLNRGVMAQGIGNVSYSLTGKEAEIYKYYSSNKSNPLFYYTILTYGSVKATTAISTELYGQLNTNSEKHLAVKFIDIPSTVLNKEKNFYPLPWAVNEYLMQTDRLAALNDEKTASYRRLPFIITIEEASQFFRLPIANEQVSAGLKINQSEIIRKGYVDNIINSGDITLGKLKSSAENNTIGLSLNDLTKHMLIVGTPGSGKTTFSIGMLDRLWKTHHIPFLVIEPAKNEYRALIQSIPDLQVFTPGKNFISPFVFNPFVPPKNVKLGTYKSSLKTAFAAAVSMSSPLDQIFEESINNCYSDFKWLDSYTSDGKGKTFNIADFIHCFQKTFDDIGYTGEALNIGRAGTVRLNSLVNLFDNYFSIPIEDLLKKPTVIELAAIENSEQKTLLIALLLLSILVYVNSNYLGTGELKNILLLEEAHVLLDAEVNTEYGEANPNGIAQSLLKRMLAEIRSYGVGIIIADQSPRKVGLDVIALTDIKLAFRLVEKTDREIIADSSNMSDYQAQHLGRLKPGEAFLFFNKLNDPEEIRTDNYRIEHNIDITLSDNAIQSLSHYWDDKQKELRPYPECTFIQFCQNDCNPETRMIAKEIARRIFNRFFNTKSQNFDTVKQVFQRLTELSKEELNDEPFTERLHLCIECHLLRRLKYSTKIGISNGTIEKTLGGGIKK